MRTLKSLFATTILGLALSMPAFADGNISTPGCVEPPLPPPPAANLVDTGEQAFADILLALLSLF
jgi:hypothetical protein